MTYEVLWVESKNDGWRIASLKEIIEGGKTFDDVSINKVDKKGREFPRFDEITPGSMVAGNMWQSPTNKKWTLYAPDEPRPAATAPAAAAGTYTPPARAGGGNRGVAAAQERKSAGIEKAQDRKETGIMISAAFRDATIILTALPEFRDMSAEEWRGAHKRIRDWYIASWKDVEKSEDVPF